MNKVDVIIIGAGAAGMMCAVEAGKRKRSVIVIEHNDSVGKKIRISGGGRCNFTNINAGFDNYLSSNPHFAKSALARFTAEDFCKLVKKYKIAFHEKKLGQLFCDKTAQDIIDLLKKESALYNVRIFLKTKVDKIAKNGSFHIETNQGSWQAESLVIATGGLSIPPLGATDFGYKTARQFGLKVTACKPGLVPLTFNAHDLKIFNHLSGISIDALVSFNKKSFRENILFTHKGFSGPAILQISSYWNKGDPVFINLLPDTDILEKLKRSHKSSITLKNFLCQYFPERLSGCLCENFFGNKPLKQYSAKDFLSIAQNIHQWKITPEGTEGYKKAEVTVGGVDTDELSSKTMEAKKVPGLYFIGEVVDVTGHLGGFNFQWAWASGFAAGEFV